MRSFTYKRRNPIRRRRRQMGGFDGTHYTPADIFHDAGHSDIVQIRIGQIVNGNKDSKVGWNTIFGEARTWEHYKNVLSKDLDYKKRIDNIVTFSIPGDTDLFGGNNKEIIFNYFGITDFATQPLFIAHDAGYPLTARINAYAPQGTYYAYDVVTAGTLVDQATRQHHPYSVYPPDFQQAIKFKGEDYFGFNSNLEYTFTIKSFNGTVSTCDMVFKNESINGDTTFTTIKDIPMKMGYSPFPFLSNDNVDKLLTYQKESIKDAIKATIPTISSDLQQAAAIMGKFMGDSMQVEMYIRQLLGRTDSVVAVAPAGAPLPQLRKRNLQDNIAFSPQHAALNTGDQLEFVRCMKRRIPSLYSSYVQREEKRIFFAIQGEGVVKKETKEGLIARFTKQFNDLIKLVSKAYISLIADLLNSIGRDIELANNTFEVDFSMYQGANLIQTDDKRDLAKRYILQCIQAVYKLGLWTTTFYITKRKSILAQAKTLADAQTYLSAEYNKLSILASNVSPQQTTLRSKEKSRLLILIFKVPAVYTDEFPKLSPTFDGVNKILYELTEEKGPRFQPELEVIPVQDFVPQRKSHTIYLVEAYNGINKNNEVSSKFTKIFRDAGTLPARYPPFSGGAILDNIPTINITYTVTFDNQNEAYYTTPIPVIDENEADKYRLPQVDYMLKVVTGTLPNIPVVLASALRSQKPGGEVADSKYFRDCFQYDLLYDYFRTNFDTVGELMRHILVLERNHQENQYACFDETLLSRLIFEAYQTFTAPNAKLAGDADELKGVSPEMIEFNIFATERNYWTLKETPVTESDEGGSLEIYLLEMFHKYRVELDRYDRGQQAAAAPPPGPPPPPSPSPKRRKTGSPSSADRTTIPGTPRSLLRSPLNSQYPASQEFSQFIGSTNKLDFSQREEGDEFMASPPPPPFPAAAMNDASNIRQRLNNQDFWIARPIDWNNADTLAGEAGVNRDVALVALRLNNSNLDLARIWLQIPENKQAAIDYNKKQGSSRRTRKVKQFRNKSFRKRRRLSKRHR